MNTLRSLSFLLLLSLLGLALAACGRPRSSSNGGGGGGDTTSDGDGPVSSDDDDDDVEGPMSGDVDVLLSFDDLGKFFTCSGSGSVDRIGDLWFGTYACDFDQFEGGCNGAVDYSDGDFEEVASIECIELLETTVLDVNETGWGSESFEAIFDGEGFSPAFGPVQVTVEMDYSPDAM
jgi:hypothetical protein